MTTRYDGVLGAGEYNTALPTVATGYKVNLQSDANGKLLVATTGVALGGAVTWSDKTITSLSGSSQTLIAANAARKGLIIKNGAVAAAINILGGTAAIGGAGCMTLQPYEALVFTGPETPLAAITVIGTSTNYVSAFEAA